MLTALLALILAANAMAIPFVQLPLSGSNFTNWGIAGPWEAPNGALYQTSLNRNGTTSIVSVESSTDGGITWLEVAPSQKSLIFAYSAAQIVGTKIYILMRRTQVGSTLGFFAVFDTTSNTWDADITGLPPAVLNNGGDQWTYQNMQFGVLSNGNIIIAQGITTSATNQPGAAINYYTWDGATWSTATLIPGQDANKSYAVRSIVVTAADNVYIFMSAYPYVQAGGSQPNGVGDLVYSKNFAAPIAISTGSLPWVWPTPASYDIGWSEHYSVGSPSYSASKIAIPFISGAGAPTSPANPPPYYSPNNQVSCAILSNVDAVESVAVEQVSVVDTVCPNALSREQALSCTWTPSGELFVCGVIATSFTTFAVTAQNSNAGNIVYWRRTSLGWGASAIVYTTTAPIAPSGVVPLVFAGTRLGFMAYTIDSTVPFDIGTRLHLFGSMVLPTSPIVITTPGDGGRKPTVLSPNQFDFCLHREYRLFCNIDYNLKGCARLPKCFTVDEREWGDQA